MICINYPVKIHNSYKYNFILKLYIIDYVRVNIIYIYTIKIFIVVKIFYLKYDYKCN
jgi:hypothetical protein